MSTGPLPNEQQWNEWFERGVVDHSWDEFVRRGLATKEQIEEPNRPKNAKRKRYKAHDLVDPMFDMKSNTWFVPLQTYSIANSRDTSRQIGSKGKEKRAVCFVLGKCHNVLATFADEGIWRSKEMGGPLTVIVKLTRLVTWNARMDEDNLSSAFKYVKDMIAEMLGSDDKNPLLKWEYAEESHEKVGVKIQMRFA